ncbi:hypothetical protein [Actinoplanes sp. NPDC049599]|uniref:hypothetical protein n=1 Tax=Actinoplanes sp. NPDC049599 TaxID=3363903 RepID=UPI0037A2BDCD
MRHLRSVLYSLVLAPAVWILCGVGFDQDLTGRARDNGGIESLSGVLLLLLAGAAYAILLFSPISPAGPLLAGLAFAGVGAWARIAPDSYAGVWPANVAEDGFDLSTPGYGLAVLLAVPLLCVALSARRWRGYEPPEILLIGTIGRARVAGTPMAAERTTFIPQQRPAPGFGPPSADATQIVPPPRPAAGRPLDDGDEKTTVMQFGRPAAPAPAQRPGGDEPTQFVAQAAEPARFVPPADEPTQFVPPADEPTQFVPPADEPTQFVPPAAEPVTEDLTADDTTRDVVAAGATPAAPADEPTGDVTGDETTRLVLPAGDNAPAADHGDERTQLLTLPRADGAADPEGPTQTVRTGTVEPPGDRTQLLTFPAPGAPATGPAAASAAILIVGAERPDPGEDPTTRLTPAGRPNGEVSPRPTPEAHPVTVSSLERPADEAADDTRPLTLPTQRPPADDDTTRHL